jgi:hypothetical protein
MRKRLALYALQSVNLGLLLSDKNMLRTHHALTMVIRAA